MPKLYPRHDKKREELTIQIRKATAFDNGVTDIYPFLTKREYVQFNRLLVEIQDIVDADRRRWITELNFYSLARLQARYAEMQRLAKYDANEITYG